MFNQLAYLKRGLICLAVMIITIDVAAQSETAQLYVGESWTIYSQANNYYERKDVNWSTDRPDCIALTWDSWESCNATPRKFFTGIASVTITYNYKRTPYGDYNFYSYTYRIECVDNPVAVSPTNQTLLVGETLQLSYSHQHSEYESSAAVSFASSSDAVTVTKYGGLVTAKKPGTAKVYVYSTLANDANAPYCTVTVNEPAPAPVIELPKKMILNVGQSMKITPLQSPGAGYTITWKSNKTTVATVNSSGVVTARKVGTARITATINGTSQSDYCDVTVKDILLGDVNDDGSVSIADVTALTNLLLNGVSYYNAAADMNQDGNVSIADVTALINYLLNGSGKRGDVNNDGHVNITDLTLLINYLLKSTTTINKRNADMNRDGKINIDDVTALIDYLLRGNLTSNNPNAKIHVVKQDDFSDFVILMSMLNNLSKNHTLEN